MDDISSHNGRLQSNSENPQHSTVINVLGDQPVPTIGEYNSSLALLNELFQQSDDSSGEEEENADETKNAQI